MHTSKLWSCAAVFCCLGTIIARSETLEIEHVRLTYEGIGPQYAQAIARTVTAARQIGIEQFAFDLPDIVNVSVKAGPSEKTRLYNDGQDHIFLTLSSEEKLRPPSLSGVFNLYGFCHELGHMAMYRPIEHRPWLTSAAAEGWAHYIGSRLTDLVYKREGEKLWPDPYDYRLDGMARLRKQLASKASGSPEAAGLWLGLGEAFGEDKNFAALFAAWGKAKVDESNPGTDLKNVLLSCGDRQQLETWWAKAEPVLIQKASTSSFAQRQAGPPASLGPAQELAKDDGASAGQKSIAGSAHAVRFEASGTNCFLTAVRVFGSRYGHPTPPAENAFVWLCDSDFKRIASFPFPYGSFQRGSPKWVTVKTTPTLVPKKFILCVGFNPTATKGVYVHYDAASCGSSLTGMPGSNPSPFKAGDWLIRAVVQK